MTQLCTREYERICREGLFKANQIRHKHWFETYGCAVSRNKIFHEWTIGIIRLFSVISSAVWTGGNDLFNSRLPCSVQMCAAFWNNIASVFSVKGVRDDNCVWRFSFTVQFILSLTPYHVLCRKEERCLVKLKNLLDLLYSCIYLAQFYETYFIEFNFFTLRSNTAIRVTPQLALYNKSCSF